MTGDFMPNDENFSIEKRRVAFEEQFKEMHACVFSNETRRVLKTHPNDPEIFVNFGLMARDLYGENISVFVKRLPLYNNKEHASYTGWVERYPDLSDNLLSTNNTIYFDFAYLKDGLPVYTQYQGFVDRGKIYYYTKWVGEGLNAENRVKDTYVENDVKGGELSFILSSSTKKV